MNSFIIYCAFNWVNLPQIICFPLFQSTQGSSIFPDLECNATEYSYIIFIFIESYYASPHFCLLQSSESLLDRGVIRSSLAVSAVRLSREWLYQYMVFRTFTIRCVVTLLLWFCISWCLRKVEYSFTCLLAIWISILYLCATYLLMSILLSILFLLWICVDFLYIFLIWASPVAQQWNITSHSFDCFFMSHVTANR